MEFKQRDRFGLGSSTAAVDEALDYLTNKELGQSARYFNQTGKAQFNQQQITHAVLSFMAGKEQQRHMTLPFTRKTTPPPAPKASALVTWPTPDTSARMNTPPAVTPFAPSPR